MDFFKRQKNSAPLTNAPADTSGNRGAERPERPWRPQRLRGPVILLILLLLIPLTLYAYKRFAPRTQPFHIYFVGKTNNRTIEFWRTVDEGLSAAAKEFNVELTKLNASDEGRVDENLTLFQEALAARPDAVILSASDYELLAAPVAEAVRAGRKVIMLDSAVALTAGAEPISLIATNNAIAGQSTADFLCGEQPAIQKVVVVSQQLGAGPADQRLSGVEKRLAQSGLSPLKVIDAHGSRERAYSELLSTLSTDSVDAVVALNEYTTEAAAQALKKAGLSGRVPLVGIDISRRLVPFIEDGTLLATVVQQPFNIGYLSVKAAVQALEGRAVPRQIDVDFKLITKAGLYLPENQKLLFPFADTEAVRQSE